MLVILPSQTVLLMLLSWLFGFGLLFKNEKGLYFYIELVNENIEEFSTAITKTPFSLQTEKNIFYHCFHSVPWQYLKMQGNVVEVIVIFFFLILGLVRLITTILDPFLAKRRGKFYQLMAV